MRNVASTLNQKPANKKAKEFTMTCYSDEKILDFLTGRMAREEKMPFKLHIMKCDHCAIRRYSKEDELLSAYYREAKSAGLI